MAVRVEYAVQESLTNIRRNLFITFAAVLVVVVSLFLAGGVALINRSVGRTARLLTEQVSVTVFLNDGISADQRASLQGQLLQMPEVANVTFETKAQAYTHFKQLFANEPDIVQNVTPDALPESFRVKLKDPSKFAVIRDRLTGRPGVREIRDEAETVKRLFSFAGGLRKLAFVMVILVGLAAMVLIATTIRMAIFARRREIGIMKLVGATNWFIRIPFMMEGIFQGLIGAAIAIGVLVAAKPALSSFSSGEGLGGPFNLKFLVTYGDIAFMSVYLILAGIAGGAVASLIGLRKFLDV